MTEPEKTDVKDESSTSTGAGEGNVEAGASEGNDKDKNFAELRKAKEAAEARAAELERQLAGNGEGQSKQRTLAAPDEGAGEGKKSDDASVLFERDMREASYRWSKTNKDVTDQEWQAIQSKVSLKGDETVSEIEDKISEAYEGLPTVREKRDQQLIEKGKKEAMRQFRPDEMDLSGGDVDLGGGEGQVRHSAKEQAWLRSFGVKPGDAAKIDREADTSGWQEGPQATRKPFQP
jgi:hypothetical protein